MTAHLRTPQDRIRFLEEQLEEKSAEVALLREQLGGVAKQAMIEALWRVGLSPQEAALFAMLHDARGRTLSRLDVLDNLPALDHVRERDSKIIDVLVSRIRRKLGAGVIETVRARGHRATQEGLSVGDKLIAGQPVELQSRAPLPYECRYKLTVDQALEVKRIGYTQTAESLAQRFGVSRAVIDKIRGGYGYQRLIAKHQSCA